MFLQVPGKSFLMWSSIVLGIGVFLLLSKQFLVLISAVLTLIILATVYWALPRYRSRPFFLLLAPSALVTWICYEAAMVDGLHFQLFFAAAAFAIALGGVIITWWLPRYELVVTPAVVGLLVASIRLAANNSLWQAVAVAFILSLLLIGALSTARRQ